MQIYTLYHLIWKDGETWTYSTPGKRAGDTHALIDQGYEPGLDFTYRNDIVDEETYGNMYFWG